MRLSPVGTVVVLARDATLEIIRATELLLAMSLWGRLTQVIVERGLLSFISAEGCATSAVLRIGPELSRRSITARLADRKVAAGMRNGRLELAFDNANPEARLDHHLAPLP